MAETRKVIITCAITGSIHTPSMSPHLPVTPQEIAEQSIAAAQAGAAIVHLHARDPADGRPTPSADTYMRRHWQRKPLLIRQALPGFQSPLTPDELIQHDVLRLKTPNGSFDQWKLLNTGANDQEVTFPVKPKLWVNHSDTLVRAAMDGAGITSAAVTLVAPQLTDGTLVRVLSPWIGGHLSLYAALPSRKFLPERTRVFLEYLTEQSRARADAMVKNISDGLACGREAWKMR